MFGKVFVLWNDVSEKLFIIFKNVIKKFGEFVVISDLNFDIYVCEFFVFLGFFGCGKIMLMCMLVGFEMLIFGVIELVG